VPSAVLALPDPSDVRTEVAATTKAPTVTVNGSSVSLEDEMGPLVVNEDGTLSRITSWAQMTVGERERTVRVLSKRNKLRLEQLMEGGAPLQDAAQQDK
jgi:hypothetical protein